MHSRCPIKYVPSWHDFGSPHLHLCSILRSWDGSCFNVKIMAVILGELTQTDNSWHKQMWSPEESAGCAGVTPMPVSFSLTSQKVSLLTWCRSHKPLIVTGESRVLGKLASISPLSFCLPFCLPLFPNDIHGFLKEILPSGKNFLDPGPYSMPRDYNNTIYGVTYCLHVLSHLASEIIQLHEHFCYLTLQMRKQTQRLQRALLKVTKLVWEGARICIQPHWF